MKFERKITFNISYSLFSYLDQDDKMNRQINCLALVIYMNSKPETECFSTQTVDFFDVLFPVSCRLALLAIKEWQAMEE